jgi:hypothetical protein
LRHVPPFGSTSIIAALNRPNAAWNFFFLPFAYAERSFFASLTMCFTITFFCFGLVTLRITIVGLLLRKNSAARAHDVDDRDGDTGGDQSVFDRSRPGFINSEALPLVSG